MNKQSTESVNSNTDQATQLPKCFPACVSEIVPAPKVLSAFNALSQQPGCLLLDSSMQIISAANQPLGRYSFLMADPFDWQIVTAGNDQPLDRIKQSLQKFQCNTLPDLPPMQGGWAGLLSYDLNRSFENVPAARIDEFNLPVIAMGCYDVVIAWDHQQDRAWIISQGFPELDPNARQERAQARLAEAQHWLAGTASNPVDRLQDPAHGEVELAEQFPARGPEKLTSNFDRPSYVRAVKTAIDYIHAGDVFQINLAQRLLHPSNCDSPELFARLRACNPAPFSGYFDFPVSASDAAATAQIISASPERFVSVRDGQVETRPIKGTRRRTRNPMVDIQARKELLASEKDRAENTMIVDLMRNDLSQVCTDDSIEVTQFCELEQYQSVLHLVSAVTGKLQPDHDAVDLIQAVFPGGSITGAPKVRAMEIISELEPTARGAYCGSLGYLGFDGNADLNILIRTVTACAGWWQIPVGGGIVAQSDPAQEYDETWTKAAGMLRAITAKLETN